MLWEGMSFTQWRNDAKAGRAGSPLPAALSDDGAHGVTRPTPQWIRAAAVLLLIFAFVVTADAAESFSWNKQTDRVTADVRSWQLNTLLERITADTGWQVFLEPNTRHDVSAKFSNLPPGQALRLLLGDLNFALVPETNGSPKLFIFRTVMSSATQLVQKPEPKPNERAARKIPNELIVTLKPGAKIDDIARALGAKVIGQIPELNAYRLQFEDDAATETARESLANNSDVAAVDANYAIGRPPQAREMLATSVPRVNLRLNPPTDSGRVIVGLIDTSVQRLGDGLDNFLLKPVSIAGEAATNGDAPTHGTSMAETILRSIESTGKGATSVQILPVDVYGPNESTSTFDVARGLVEAVNGGANILNLSLGGYGDSAFMRNVVQQINQRSIPVFAAAGNEPVTTAFYPAAYPEVIAVTAGMQGKIANYANYGGFVDIAAPDVNVIYYGGKPFYVRGTSASAAFASGMAAAIADSMKRSPSDAAATVRQNLAVKTAP
jgi:hypothetical protein